MTTVQNRDLIFEALPYNPSGNPDNGLVQTEIAKIIGIDDRTVTNRIWKMKWAGFPIEYGKSSRKRKPRTWWRTTASAVGQEETPTSAVGGVSDPRPLTEGRETIRTPEQKYILAQLKKARRK